jgi:hypothetical protein
MRRQANVILLLVPAVAASVLACSSGPSTSRVCVDRDRRVVEENQCGSGPARHSGGTSWYYGNFGRNYTVGATANGGSYTPPAGIRIRSGYVARGGFGASAVGRGIVS